MPSHRVRRPAAVLCAGLLVAVAGCGATDDKASGDGSASPTPTPITPSATVLSPSPSSSPTSTPPTASSPKPGLASRLLDATALPGLNSGFRWVEGRTVRADPKPFGICQRFDLVSVGASRVVERTFTPAAGGSATAAEQIASFPDADNTHRASAVLNAWHDRCATRIGGGRVKVQPMTDVPVSAGTGAWYLVSVVPRGADDGEFHATGIVVAGSTIALLRMDSRGQDYDYPAGQEPMVRAVAAAARKLG